MTHGKKANTFIIFYLLIKAIFIITNKINFLYPDLKHIPTVENLFFSHENLSFIEHNGVEIKVEWLQEYQSDQSLYHCQYALLDNKVLIISSDGDPIYSDIIDASENIKKSLAKRKLKNLDLVYDVRNSNNPGYKVRKAILQCNIKLSKFWNTRYLVIKPKFKSLIRIYKFIYQGNSDNLYFAGSIDEALSKIVLNSPITKDINFSPVYNRLNRNSLLNKTKDELIEIVESYQTSQVKSTNSVLEAIDQLSQGGHINVDNQVSDHDPNFELISALSLLQQDVGEIISDFKELNQNLELKVADRIVDYIDKESNLRSILDNSDRVTWLLNARFELIDFNEAFSSEIKRRYNITPEKNQNILILLRAEKERNAWKDRIESALNGKPGIYLDQDNFDGQERVWEIKIFPIKEIGKIKGVSVYIEDITSLKESQLKLIEKNRDLQKVNSELDSFVYRVSHDLRAPLTSILGLISLMKTEDDKDKLSEYINLQEKSIQKLDLFIKEIINLSRNSRLGITIDKINFDELLDELFENQHYTQAAEKVKRICIVDENISFYTDRQRLSTVLNNLISNSLKYINVHLEDPFVKIEVYPKNEGIAIRVSDNGIGISENYLPKIFEMFFRATQAFSGSGLGLYIVKETIGKLDGKIKAKSKFGEGTVFEIFLPNLVERYKNASIIAE